MQSSHHQTWPQRQGQQKSWQLREGTVGTWILRLATMQFGKKRDPKNSLPLMVVVFKWWCDFPIVESKQSPTKKQIQGPSVWDSFDFQIVRNFKTNNHKTRTLSHIHTLGIYSFTYQQRPVTMLAMLQWSFPHSLGDLSSESLGKDLVDISSGHHAGSRRGGCHVCP